MTHTVLYRLSSYGLRKVVSIAIFLLPTIRNLDALNACIQMIKVHMLITEQEKTQKLLRKKE